MENILNEETFIRWFSSKTDAGGQLKNTILHLWTFKMPI